MEPQGGGPAPFLQKTYDMVDDSSTDAIVSWGSDSNTFVVWDHVEFARVLLPSFFKHGNFSSFIRQLNTYGFRKVDPEKWAFSNEDFVRDERHRLKNIHRRKPIHSHSHPIGTPDLERVALEEEIDRLSRERDKLQKDLCAFQHVEVGSGFQFGNVESKLENMEQRQNKLINFLNRAVQNPSFVEQLVTLADVDSIDFFMFSKKRRSLPRGGVDGGSELVDNGCNDGHSSTSKPLEFSHLIGQDFSKLKLELCPAVSEGILVLSETQKSNEGRSSPKRVELEGNSDIMECHLFMPEEVEPMDTSVSLSQKRSNSLPWLPSNDDEEGQHISCQLKLTLASSPLHFDESQLADRVSKSMNVEDASGLRSNNGEKNDYFEWTAKERDNHGDRVAGITTNLPVASTANNHGHAPAAGRVNDLFWEQFLTERPGSLENEEASSSLRSNTQEERMPGSETWMNRKDMGDMKL